ncbi:hypothetical protein LCGC14_0491840 [marine sediment metagenome]|uniref:site-specific DNA-methyltransferase (cytosine-N(4)-specific) n=1 Tax=marine sediment metagenome TaxID=412755 RepID=A0A0F9UTD3_9ZZZZ
MDSKSYKFDFVPISNELTEFEKSLSNLELIRYIEHPDLFFKETAYLKKVDGKESYYNLFSKIKSNNFNKGSGYLTHGFDFYRGSFHGQLIRGLINSCNLKEDSMILDPFCGSGTTLVESSLLGFNSIGIDINPIACLNSKIKTHLLDYEFDHFIQDNERYFNLSFFEELQINLPHFKVILDKDIKELFYIFIYLRSLSMEFRLSTDKKKNFRRIYIKLINVLKLFCELKKDIDINLGKSTIFFGDSLVELKKIKTNSIDAIITSPPYLDLIDYIQEDLISINFLFKKSKIDLIRAKSIPLQSSLFIPVQVKFPLATIETAKVLAPQSVGFPASAVAVLAFPVKAPTKPVAVTSPLEGL